MSGRGRLPEWERNDARPRAVLVGVDRGSGEWPLEESLEELRRLAETAGLDVSGTTTQRLDKVNPRTFIGSGKAEEIAELAARCGAATVVFDDDLTPRQQANLETMIPDTRIVDRTALILEIFALHAVSREGKLQVELAQLEYLLPRLRGMWGHLERERLGGGRGARFGAGESQLETDRRLARKRISVLKKELRHVASARQTQRKARAESGVFRVALIGYTNAGKSSLLNCLTGADVLAYDMLFATLDSTTRKVNLPDGREMTLTDTVGFINKLPHGLVEAFKSTLDEVVQADLLLHVVDASHPQAVPQMAAVDRVLGEVGATGIPTLLVFNKADLIGPEDRARIAMRHQDAVVVSAQSGEGTPALMERIALEATRDSTTLTLMVPFAHGDLVRLLHDRAHVVSEHHTAEGTHLVARVSPNLAQRFADFVVSEADTRARSDLAEQGNHFTEDRHVT